MTRRACAGMADDGTEGRDLVYAIGRGGFKIGVVNLSIKIWRGALDPRGWGRGFEISEGWLGDAAWGRLRTIATALCWNGVSITFPFRPHLSYEGQECEFAID